MFNNYHYNARDWDELRQTNRLYGEIKKYYEGKITGHTPFPVVAVYINSCIKKFSKKPPYKVMPYKVISLSINYLQEIRYDFDK